MKVKCTSREESIGSHYNAETKTHEPVNLFTYRFAFVSGDDSPENASFWQYTPSGQFQLSTVLIDAFRLGEYYYLDAIPAGA
jgi:hypothetical protein